MVLHQDLFSVQNSDHFNISLSVRNTKYELLFWFALVIFRLHIEKVFLQDLSPFHELFSGNPDHVYISQSECQKYETWAIASSPPSWASAYTLRHSIRIFVTWVIQHFRNFDHIQYVNQCSKCKTWGIILIHLVKLPSIHWNSPFMNSLETFSVRWII